MTDESESERVPVRETEKSDLRVALRRADEGLAQLRADTRRRRVALAGAVLVGLALSWLHWVGLFVAGALVGLTQPSLPRALSGGFGFGLVALGVFFLVTPLVTPGNVSALAPLSYLTLGLGVLGPTWGALLRGAI